MAEMELPYDPSHPDNQYPKFRHHATEESVLVKNPSDELENAPDSEGFFDLKRDALDAAKAKGKGLSGAKKAGPANSDAK